MTDLFKSINSIKAQMEGNMPFLSARIDRLIQSKSKDVQEIEGLLDVLLDYQHMGVGEPDFNRLNEYYGTIDIEASLDWKRMQKDI